MKKKKPKFTPNAGRTNLNAKDFVRQTAARLNAGNLPPTEKLVATLDKALEKADSEKDPPEKAELLATLLSTDFVSLEDDSEEVLAFYEDVADLLTETLADCDDAFALELLLNFVAGDTGSEARSDLYSVLGERLAGEVLTRELNQILDGALAEEAENLTDILNAAAAVSLGAKDFETFERASFALDEGRSNETLLAVATEYLSAKRLDDVKRLLAEVKDPVDDDLQDYLDLKAAIASAEGNEKELRKLATELYEKFPTEDNLVRLAGVLPQKARYDLLVEHGKFRLGSAPSTEFMFAMAVLKEFDLLSAYITHISEEALAGLDAEDLEALVQALETEGQAELAQRIKNWIVEEPTDLRE